METENPSRCSQMFTFQPVFTYLGGAEAELGGPPALAIPVGL